MGLGMAAAGQQQRQTGGVKALHPGRVQAAHTAPGQGIQGAAQCGQLRLGNAGIQLGG